MSPAVHGGPLPQRHPVPPKPQVSASGPQGLQVVRLTGFRQLVTLVGMHWPVGPPEQQPDGQELALQPQVPAPQLWPAEQLGFVPQRQTPFAPQPFAR